MTSDKRTLAVPETSAGKRLDLFVGEAFGLSRAKLKALFEDDKNRVDGRKAKKGQQVAAGQQISVEVDPEVERTAAPDSSVALSLLHEDGQLLFVDKPAHVPAHPLAPGETGTVANALAARFPECTAASEDPREAGLCHRLDIETSGVLLAARTREAWTALREQFTARSVDKRYLALVTGPLADEGTVDLPLRHHPRHPDRVEPALDEGKEGREALSEFKVLQREGEYALVEVRIHTGVLHQVRAHLGAIGASIVGDGIYGGRPEPELSRFFLHARSLSVTHPVSGEKLSVTSPLPAELLASLARHGLAAP